MIAVNIEANDVDGLQDMIRLRRRQTVTSIWTWVDFASLPTSRSEHKVELDGAMPQFGAAQRRCLPIRIHTRDGDVSQIGVESPRLSRPSDAHPAWCEVLF